MIWFEASSPYLEKLCSFCENPFPTDKCSYCSVSLHRNCIIEHLKVNNECLIVRTCKYCNEDKRCELELQKNIANSFFNLTNKFKNSDFKNKNEILLENTNFDRKKEFPIEIKKLEIYDAAKQIFTNPLKFYSVISNLQNYKETIIEANKEKNERSEFLSSAKISNILQNFSNSIETAICKKCERFFHSYENKIKKEKNIFDICLDCRYCISCNVFSYENVLLFFLGIYIVFCQNCEIIFKKNEMCNICFKEFKTDDFDIEMMQCDFCHRWIHLDCDTRISYDNYLLLSKNSYLCVECTEGLGFDYNKIFIGNISNYDSDSEYNVDCNENIESEDINFKTNEMEKTLILNDQVEENKINSENSIESCNYKDKNCDSIDFYFNIPNLNIFENNLENKKIDFSKALDFENQLFSFNEDFTEKDKSSILRKYLIYYKNDDLKCLICCRDLRRFSVHQSTRLICIKNSFPNLYVHICCVFYYWLEFRRIKISVTNKKISGIENRCINYKDIFDKTMDLNCEKNSDCELNNNRIKRKYKKKNTQLLEEAFKKDLESENKHTNNLKIKRKRKIKSMESENIFPLEIIYKSIKSFSCVLCKENGANIKCIDCKDGYYHFDCSLNILFIGQSTVPRCRNHFFVQYFEFGKIVCFKNRKEKNETQKDKNIELGSATATEKNEISEQEIGKIKTKRGRKKKKCLIEERNESNKEKHLNMCLRYKNVIYMNDLWCKIFFLQKTKNFLFFDGFSFWINENKVFFPEISYLQTNSEEITIEDLFLLNEDGYKTFLDVKKKRNVGKRSKHECLDFEHQIIKENYLNSNFSKLIYFFSKYFLLKKFNMTLTYFLNFVELEKGYCLKKSQIQGYGLFANRVFLPDEPVIKYIGEMIDVTESNFRESFYGKDRCYMFKYDDDMIIDATMLGGLAKYINHSCDPNCYSTKVVCGDNIYIFICSKRIITVDEELSYDYFFEIDEFNVECQCGSKKCKKYLH
ncbi:SET domain-containing protein [Hamiltosporidium magnivora]|uniref:[histone H3]-lysine(4) N-trimethyltransferase n=1 Tax=Hamiltosporidium magnivora TaxID=148818 RepID=A0A4Q9LF79_9MICR|nr:SET domain-containing protein [Hamiltosporidium magnivora]